MDVKIHANGRASLYGVISNDMTPEELRKLSWKLQNAATEIDGLKVAQVSRDCLPPEGLLVLPHCRAVAPEAFDANAFRYSAHEAIEQKTGEGVAAQLKYLHSQSTPDWRPSFEELQTEVTRLRNEVSKLKVKIQAKD